MTPSMSRFAVLTRETHGPGVVRHKRKAHDHYIARKAKERMQEQRTVSSINTTTMATITTPTAITLTTAEPKAHAFPFWTSAFIALLAGEALAARGRRVYTHDDHPAPTRSAE